MESSKCNAAKLVTALVLGMGRLAVAASLVVGCNFPSEAQSGSSPTEPDARASSNYPKALPKIPATVPEEFRADYLTMVEVRRELNELQPLFPHLGVLILQELKELEKRPEGSRGFWAEPMRRRHTSRGGILGSTTITQSVGGRDRFEGLTSDEREVQAGGVQKRLIRLAITGRITEQEYNTFVRRIQVNL
jgi:hypothetical protein